MVRQLQVVILTFAGFLVHGSYLIVKEDKSLESYGLNAGRLLVATSHVVKRRIRGAMYDP